MHLTFLTFAKNHLLVQSRHTLAPAGVAAQSQAIRDNRHQRSSQRWMDLTENPETSSRNLPKSMDGTGNFWVRNAGKITIKIIKVSFKSSNIFLESKDLKRLLSVHSAAFCHLCHFLFDGVTEFGPAWFQSQSGGTNLEITTSSLPFPGHISQRFFLWGSLAIQNGWETTCGFIDLHSSWVNFSLGTKNDDYWKLI
jgi:hypothetical protein